jgi:hypothetical protein
MDCSPERKAARFGIGLADSLCWLYQLLFGASDFDAGENSSQ